MVLGAFQGTSWKRLNLLKAVKVLKAGIRWIKLVVAMFGPKSPKSPTILGEARRDFSEHVPKVPDL